jgi:cytochrome c-type biogenesis protein
MITASLGRLLGDMGIGGNFVIALIFIVIGLYLLVVISLKWNGVSISSRTRLYLSAFGLGLLFGIRLGPCTFAYLVPVLGIVFLMAQSGWLKPVLLVFAFTIGHCSVIAQAGGLGQWVQNYMNWSSQSHATVYIIKTAGVLVMLGGFYFIFTAFGRG